MPVWQYWPSLQARTQHDGIAAQLAEAKANVRKVEEQLAEANARAQNAETQLAGLGSALGQLRAEAAASRARVEALECDNARLIEEAGSLQVGSTWWQSCGKSEL